MGYWVFGFGIWWVLGFNRYSMFLCYDAIGFLPHCYFYSLLSIYFLGVLLGAGNAVGGYVVTERMLQMFVRSDKPDNKLDGDKG